MAGGVAGLEALCPDGIWPRPPGEKQHEPSMGSGPDGLVLMTLDGQEMELGDVGVLCAMLRRPGVRDRVTELGFR